MLAPSFIFVAYLLSPTIDFWPLITTLKTYYTLITSTNESPEYSAVCMHGLAGKQLHIGVTE